MAYNQSRRLRRPLSNNPTPNSPPQTNENSDIRINGFKQVVDMLMAADPEFRESLLNRIQKYDATLARSLRSDIKHNTFV